jgi:hypothetical protein
VTVVWTAVLAGWGTAVSMGAVALRTEPGHAQRRRVEIARYTWRIALIALAYLGAIHAVDLTAAALAVWADSDHAAATGEAGAHCLLPRSTDAEYGRTL